MDGNKIKIINIDKLKIGIYNHQYNKMLSYV